MDVHLQSSKILSAAEEKAIDTNIKELKDIRDEVEVMQGVSREAKDKGAIDKRISDLEKIKQTHGIPIISSEDRNRAMSEIKRLEEALQKDMPTWDEYVSLNPKHGPRYTALVRKIVKWEADPVRRQMVQRWKTLRRLVDPSDPQAGNVMYLFPQ